MALDSFSRSTLSPIMVRRRGLSVSQLKPFSRAPTARCQTCSTPNAATIARIIEVSASSTIVTASSRRRSTRSTTAPSTAPNRPMGTRRSMVTSETTKGEPVSR